MSENIYLRSNPPKDVEVLPIEGQRNILITSALPYVNNVPHLGNIIGCVLSGDVYSRYCRLKGHNCIYICGTDEYGTATETKALQEKCTPKEICDRYHAIHKEIYEWFNIGFDKFGRTSTQSQTEITQDIFMKLHQNGLTFSDTVEQLFCEQCKIFLADRYVEGICPHCQYEDARGDQCDKCTKLLNPTDLIQPRCKVCSTTPIIKSTKHIFLDLPKVQERLDTFVQGSSGKWSENSQNITNSWVKGELKPRCITRDLKWGTPVPLEEFKEKVFYVWFDAPIGYLSITKEYTKEWEKWWKNPENVELVQFMGKDNVPFHTVIFPSSLIGTEDPYTMLHNLSTTEYLNYETGKFSKSRNTGVFGDGARDTKIPADIWRFYLLSNRPEVSDSVFSWDDFSAKTLELLNNFGNLVNRVLKFVSVNFDGKIPKIDLNDSDKKFVQEVNDNVKLYHEALEAVRIKEGLRLAMAISRLGNQYQQENKPWEVIKTDKARCGASVALLVNTIKLLATLFEPYLPLISQQIHEQLNFESTKYTVGFEFLIPEGHEISKNITPLIQAIPDVDLKSFRTKFAGAVADEFPLDLRVAKIVEVEDHPAADSLYIIKCDIGGGVTKRAVAGLTTAFTKSQLVGQKLAVLLNLKPSKFKGVQSEAMIVVADDKSPIGVSLLLSDAEIGSKIGARDSKIVPKSNIDYQKEFIHMDLRVIDGVPCYKEKPLLVNGKPLDLQKKEIISAKLR
ncbi:methionyl-tRNA synthetase [Cavenderia fasciculata]|uniref:methionine--tRNA ligase n=1 Tax=Cavenderia fasciculata TaxID=261658 RepID=F4QEW8_CACFS|nr:methionyl-tRNA synthetase [Cavenderia fasciculata]EGG14175.1 methionyl-tRNA synthetase [Cavenderia fasciculata]|eukprot:XP_004350883.1 methionyl-tRNA synthetase [Cavenderia fasciculata]